MGGLCHGPGARPSEHRMKAHLDHVGIAVSDLASSLGFFRDALGLEVHGVEEVGPQRVRAHFVAAGGSTLELLEATAPDSPIAKYVAKRGPGLHHITLRVDDLRAALSQLKSRGVRLIDEEPRPGAEQALVAFIHPASAHGVLVELKQERRASTPLTVSRYTVGDLELVSLYDGFLKLDGGAMFGVVPKVRWEPQAPPDDRNRITLAMRPLLVRGEKTLLIDAGIGDTGDARFKDVYGVNRSRNLDHALAEAGLSVDDIDVVLATHLHFDHAGGFTVREGDRVRPKFPRARYMVRRGEWDDATRTHERNRASYIPDHFLPLLEAGVVDFVESDEAVMPGVRVQRTGGHTAHHQIVWIESGPARAVFTADLVPTAAHLPDTWIMGYDLYPMDTLAAKKAFSDEATARETLVFLEHDPAVAAAFISGPRGKRTLRLPT